MLAIAFAVAGITTATALWFWSISPGRPRPLTDDVDGSIIPGSISERTMVEIGGVRQGMFLQSYDPQKNPVLLFLHGGPGMPEFFLNTRYPTGLERDFTVVWWEQRGAGISWSDDLDRDSLTVDRMIADTVEVADYLRQRFHKTKIYLLGHSWGSFLGIQVAAKAPEKFHAYIGMAQVVHQLRSEVIAKDRMILAYQARGDAAMVRRLEHAQLSMAVGMSEEYLKVRDAAMHQIGAGTTRDMDSVVTGICVPFLMERAYMVTEKINIWRAKSILRQKLWSEILHTDLTKRIRRLDLPVYFFAGAHDLTAMPELSRHFLDTIEAPVKQYYLFLNSAHSPLFEEPGKATAILRSLSGR